MKFEYIFNIQVILGGQIRFMRALLFIALLFLVLTGCTNPTQKYHPFDKPEYSKGEIVKYEDAKINTRYRSDFAYEIKTPGSEDSVKFYTANHFCYDPQNRNIVVPLKDRNGFEMTSPADGLFIAIPRDSVTLCKNGVRNNSDFARNHALHGFTYGAIVGGAIMGLGALAMAPIFLFYSEGAANVGLIIVGMVGVGAGAGGLFGTTVDLGYNGKVVEEFQESCSAYFTEEELEKYLNDNLCY